MRFPKFIMGLFKKKSKNFIDLSEHYRKKQQQIADMKSEMQEESSPSQPASTNSPGVFGGFFDSGTPTNNVSATPSETTEAFGDTVNPDERRRRLARRLKDMTEKIEDLSNQIYHLQQRLEVVERKNDVGRF
jgi:hypothetical protein